MIACFWCRLLIPDAQAADVTSIPSTYGILLNIANDLQDKCNNVSINPAVLAALKKGLEEYKGPDRELDYLLGQRMGQMAGKTIVPDTKGLCNASDIEGIAGTSSGLFNVIGAPLVRGAKVDLALPDIKIPVVNRDLLPCPNIASDADRLACYDKAIPPKVHVTQNEKMNMIDLLADIKQLTGKKVETTGVLLMMGQMAILYPERGSAAGLFIEVDKVSRSERKAILAGCTGGCDVSVKGSVSDLLIGMGIVATSVILN
eukprot:gene12172-12258_t